MRFAWHSPFSRFPHSRIIRGGTQPVTPGTVSDAENGADETTPTYPVSTAEELNNAFNTILADNSGAANYVIQIQNDFDVGSSTPLSVPTGKTVTIRGNGHTISNICISVEGNGTTLNLGQPGSADALTLIGSFPDRGTMVFCAEDGGTLNLFGNTRLLHQGDGAIIGLSGSNTTGNMYDNSCVDGSLGGYMGVFVANGSTLNMYGSSTIRNIYCAPTEQLSVYNLCRDGLAIANLSGLVGSSTVTMNDNSTIESCAAGIFCRGDVTMNGNSTIRNCAYLQLYPDSYYYTFEGGSGVFMDEDSEKYSFTMNDNSSIEDCTSADGGAVHFEIRSTGTFIMNDNSRLANNTAVNNGGAIYSYGGTIIMNDNSSMTGNSAGKNGGAVCMVDGSLTMNGGCIENNSARSGGGIFRMWVDHLCGPQLYLQNGCIANNTAAEYGADLYSDSFGLSSRPVPFYLPDAAGMNATTADGHKITGWYADGNPRHSPDSYHAPFTDDDLSGGLVASYVDEHCSPINFTVNNPDNADSDSECKAYYESDFSGEELEGAFAGKKVYLIYAGNYAFDGWTSEDVEIHDADKRIAAWFIMPDTPVTICANEHYATAALETDLNGKQFEPDTATEFTISFLPNSNAETVFKGHISFTGPGKIEKLEYYNDTSYEHNVLGAELQWHELTPSEDGDSFVFSEHFVRALAAQGLGGLFTAGLFSTDKPITFRITATEPGLYQANLTLVKYDEDGITYQPGDTVCTLPVSFTVGSAVEPGLPGGSDTPEAPAETVDPVFTGIAIAAGTAAVGGATYLVGTQIWLNNLYGFVPETRIQLAEALWNKAGCPAPQSTALYPDIDPDDTSAQLAARWCVEQGLLKDYHEQNDDGTETVTFKPGRYVARPYALTRWYKLEKLLNEQAGQ